MPTLPSKNAHAVHIGKFYSPAKFETRTPTTYSARMPDLGSESERLQRALLRPALDSVPISSADYAAAWDRVVAIAAVCGIVLTLAAVHFHWI